MESRDNLNYNKRNNKRSHKKLKSSTGKCKIIMVFMLPLFLFIESQNNSIFTSLMIITFKN